MTDDTCSHGQASLCDGFLDGKIVECPFHSGTVDVSTGAALTYPATEPLRTYTCRIEAGEIVIDIE